MSLQVLENVANNPIYTYWVGFAVGLVVCTFLCKSIKCREKKKRP